MQDKLTFSMATITQENNQDTHEDSAAVGENSVVRMPAQQDVLQTDESSLIVNSTTAASLGDTNNSCNLVTVSEKNVSAVATAVNIVMVEAIDSIASLVIDLQLSSSVDPAVYAPKKLTAADINLCLKCGPFQPPDRYEFPKTSGRSFQREWFYKIIAQDNMKQRRNWLSYCQHVNR